MFPFVFNFSCFSIIAAFSFSISAFFVSSFQVFALLHTGIIYHGNLCLLLGFSGGGHYIKIPLHMKFMILKHNVFLERKEGSKY